MDCCEQPMRNKRHRLPEWIKFIANMLFQRMEAARQPVSIIREGEGVNEGR